MLTNRRLSAAEALEWGLVNRVVPDDELTAATAELAFALASGATLAYGAVKQLLHSSLSETLETQMELEARLIARLASGSDGQEGISAFLEKRPPRYTGS